ncbi:MAG: hypothetical protein QNJ71_04900 [Acidimicrobiia bacterium]|nr:hypothetical protein [Acidimicrobiia bacterium]
MSIRSGMGRSLAVVVASAIAAAGCSAETDPGPTEVTQEEGTVASSTTTEDVGEVATGPTVTPTNAAVGAAGSEGAVSLVWGYCGGGSPHIVVATLGEPFQLLSHLSGHLLGGGIISWAPDRSGFATVSLDGGIAVVDAATGSLSQITDGRDSDPSWSNDGTAIAFHRFADGAADLWLVHPDGSGLEQLTNTPQTWEFSPSWSPDGSQIAYVASDSPEESGFDVWVMGRSSADADNLTNSPLFAYGDLAWSPDGSELAVTAFTSAYPDVVIVSLSGGQARNLTKNVSLSAADPAWSPDGRRIAYSQGAENGESDIWVMDPDGGNAEQWTDFDECEWNPVWEPWPGAHPVTSDWVAFTSDEPPASVSHP